MHNIGEVWASALLEVRARFITRLGWAAGNERILQFVTDGMKLDPINPTLLQGRDAILAAADAGGGTAADRLDIWSGFAARGMGASAQVLNADHWPGGAGLRPAGHDRRRRDARCRNRSRTGRLDPYETVTVSLCVTNAGVATSASVTGTLLATGGVRSPSGPQSYGAIAPGATRVSHLHVHRGRRMRRHTDGHAADAGDRRGDANPHLPVPGQPGALLQPGLRRRDTAGAAERVDHEHAERRREPLGDQPWSIGLTVQPCVCRRSRRHQR